MNHPITIGCIYSTMRNCFTRRNFLINCVIPALLILRLDDLFLLLGGKVEKDSHWSFNWSSLLSITWCIFIISLIQSLPNPSFFWLLFNLLLSRMIFDSPPMKFFISDITTILANFSKFLIIQWFYQTLVIF